jgi:DNA modification methylase
MSEIKSDTIDLVITSPPYPMIEMWDALFSTLNEDIQQFIQEGDGNSAFNLMHEELEKIWNEVGRVVKPGGIVCINVGDATRNINKNFQLFTNHVRITTFFQNNGFIVLPITTFFQNNGFIVLPCILWRKPTNSPNKFLGSGMLPTNAYITLEHEYILIFRKGDKKRKLSPGLEHRYNSAYFWEERNKWFSDLWPDIRGMSQKLSSINENKKIIRERSAAFPLKLPYRLINMFSIYGDTVLDPFWGTGTTTFAAMVSGRNSIGYEINSEFLEGFKINLKELKNTTKSINNNRIKNHIEFIESYKKSGKEPKYLANNYKFPVITKQEIEILLFSIINYIENNNEFTVNYSKFELEQKDN